MTPSNIPLLAGKDPKKSGFYQIGNCPECGEPRFCHEGGELFPPAVYLTCFCETPEHGVTGALPDRYRPVDERKAIDKVFTLLHEYLAFVREVTQMQEQIGGTDD